MTIAVSNLLYAIPGPYTTGTSLTPFGSEAGYAQLAAGVPVKLTQGKFVA